MKLGYTSYTMRACLIRRWQSIYYCFYENPIRLSYTFRKNMDERLTCKAHPLLKDDSERGSYKTKSLIPALEMKHELFVRNNIPNEKCTCSTHSSCLCSDGKYRIFANFTLSFHPNIARPSLLSSFQLFKGNYGPCNCKLKIYLLLYSIISKKKKKEVHCLIL